MGTTNLDALTLTGALVAPGGVTAAITGNVAGNVTGQITYTTVARTATEAGTGTGTIAAAGLLQFVTVTSANAAHIIVLPAPTPGTIVLLHVGATGFELRTSAVATISINAGTLEAAAESAIPANTLVMMVCTTATTWQGWDLTGVTFAAVEASAAV